MRPILAPVLAAAASAVLFGAASAPAVAGTVQCSVVTGSCYEYINYVAGQPTNYTTWTWLEASADAQTRTYLASDGTLRVGHLATITSAQEENILITYWLGDILYGQPHIGLVRLPSADPLTGWQWVTGEAYVYNNWFGPPGDVDAGNPQEPNNAGGAEYYGAYRSYNVASTTSYSGYGWNDVSSGYRAGYFIEYSPVPSPGVLALIALGGLGLIGAGRVARRT
jgi:hypothetical protein